MKRLLKLDYIECIIGIKQAHKQRAAIEPVIGHLKTDHRLERNFYKEIVGDNINIMLAAAGFNFKRMMNKWKLILFDFFQKIFSVQMI